MKKRTIGFLTFFLLMQFFTFVGPFEASEQENSEQSEIEQVVENYIALKNRILSTLTYEDSIRAFLAPEITQSKEAVSEADVLDAITGYRKAQVNDLRFERYTCDLTFDSVDVKDQEAWAAVNENIDLYFDCAPTVRNHQMIAHTIMLRKYGEQWLILRDDYTDADGVKKLLTKYFIEKGVSLEEAKKMILSQAEGQITGHMDQLEKIMGTYSGDKLMVLFAGRPVAYAAGAAVKIDSDSSVVPIMREDRVLLPVRFIAEKLQTEITWDQESSAVILSNNLHKVKVKLGDREMTVDGRRVPMDVPAQLVNDRTMLPVRAVSDALGKKVFWDERGLILLSDRDFDRNENAQMVENLVEYYDGFFTKANFPHIDGSTATYPLSIELGKELLGLDEIGAKGFLTHNTTHDAYVNLIDAKADIIFVTQPSPEEEQLAKQNRVELEVVPICKEGFVFLVNKENKVQNLSAQQIQDIYQGKINNWKEVGGENNPIIAYQREANSGSQTLMENTVMKGLKLMQPPKETLVQGMGGLIDRVADYSNAKNALGYSVYYYATQMYQNRNVRLIAVNGVEASKQTIGDGTYPFTVGYYAVLRKDEPQDSNARRLLRWLLGKEGQRIVDRAGLVPVQ